MITRKTAEDMMLTSDIKVALYKEKSITIKKVETDSLDSMSGFFKNQYNKKIKFIIIFGDSFINCRTKKWEGENIVTKIIADSIKKPYIRALNKGFLGKEVVCMWNKDEEGIKEMKVALSSASMSKFFGLFGWLSSEIIQPKN